MPDWLPSVGFSVAGVTLSFTDTAVTSLLLSLSSPFVYDIEVFLLDGGRSGKFLFYEGLGAGFLGSTRCLLTRNLLSSLWSGMGSGVGSGSGIGSGTGVSG